MKASQVKSRWCTELVHSLWLAPLCSVKSKKVLIRSNTYRTSSCVELKWHKRATSCLKIVLTELLCVLAVGLDPSTLRPQHDLAPVIMDILSLHFVQFFCFSCTFVLVIKL